MGLSVLTAVRHLGLSPAAISATDMTSSQISTVGSSSLIFIVSALLILLVARDLVDMGTESNYRFVRILGAVVIPLLLTFAAIVLFESLRVINS